MSSIIVGPFPVWCASPSWCSPGRTAVAIVTKYSGDLRALFCLGQQADSRAAARQLYAAGIGAGERAVALNPERVEGHFWVGVNLGLFAQSGRSFRALRALGWARTELESASRISDSYHDAGPLRVLGR